MANNYQMPNISNNEVYRLISHSISNNIPLSLTRFGDGEISLLEISDGNKSYPHILEQAFSSPMGAMYKLDYSRWEEWLSICDGIMKEAIKNSDIIATHHHNDEWGITESYLNGREKDLLLCYHNINISRELGDARRFKEVLNQNDLNIVSSNTDALKRVGMGEVLEANVYYTDISLNSTVVDIEDIYREVDKISESVVIVALGTIGKGIPQRLSKMGKVCLDYGSTIDAWAGIITRPFFSKGEIAHHCLLRDPSRVKSYYEQIRCPINGWIMHPRDGIIEHNMLPRDKWDIEIARKWNNYDSFKDELGVLKPYFWRLPETDSKPSRTIKCPYCDYVIKVDS